MPPLEKLQEISRTLLDESRAAYSLRDEVLELRSILETASGFDLAQENIAAGETRTNTGVAISPTMAAMCVDDFARTVQFLRGVHNAIVDIAQRTRPVNVLYAGCGPFATLAVPLMSQLAAGEARFTLLDVHERSISSVLSLIKSLGFEDRVVDMHVADAADHKIDGSPDLIVVEMLRAALESEPQVAVTRNLMQQAPDAVLIPEQVRIDLALVGGRKECSSPTRDRIHVATVFRTDGDNSVVSVTMPDFDPSNYVPTLLTTIEVYRGIKLSDFDSGITLPKKISPTPAPGETIEFVYEMGSNPRLTIRVIQPSP